jgi:archaemetzincin
MLTRRAWLTLSSLLTLDALLFAERTAQAQDKQKSTAPKLLLVPLGNALAESEVEYVRKSLSAFYDFEIEVHTRAALPASAFYSPRKRYRAEKLLTHLNQLAPKTAMRVVGLTGVDISTTKGNVSDWGILGLATIDGRVCVLSNHRCQRGTRTNEERSIRFGKVAVHEVGHTLGLEHCPTFGCLMEDAKGSVFTTDREYDLCDKCRALLKNAGHEARVNPTIPWPKPESASRTATNEPLQ